MEATRPPRHQSRAPKTPPARALSGAPCIEEMPAAQPRSRNWPAEGTWVPRVKKMTTAPVSIWKM